MVKYTSNKELKLIKRKFSYRTLTEKSIFILTCAERVNAWLGEVPMMVEEVEVEL